MRPLYGEGDVVRERPIKPRGSYRSPFRRDYARLLHSPSFRRLQGKTQLFPGAESDFFRNRLTHSLEVAQIAKSISLRLNGQSCHLREDPIDVDLIETAALAHDLGHPPFGHNGERALDECMREDGGFEGNAQTLRILAKLEKKEPHLDFGEDQEPTGVDRRVGLNLTYRTLAAVLKYDKCIPERRPKAGLVKGYYESERELVERVKERVAGPTRLETEFKTVECQIMDLADDIAYSTYDLEDALKAELVSPMSMISALNLQPIMRAVRDKTDLEDDEIVQHVMDIWQGRLGSAVAQGERRSDGQALEAAAKVYHPFAHLSGDGALRTGLTSELVDEYVEAVEIEYNECCPPLSRITFDEKLRVRVEVVKHLTYALVVNSPNLKTVEYRGSRIVKAIFDALSEPDGDLLLPDDYQAQLRHNDTSRGRTICDFIAGMTDRYALEFYGRLHSEGAQTIFKPL